MPPARPGGGVGIPGIGGIIAFKSHKIANRPETRQGLGTVQVTRNYLRLCDRLPRLAMMDLLLSATIRGSVLTNLRHWTNYMLWLHLSTEFDTIG